MRYKKKLDLIFGPLVTKSSTQEPVSLPDWLSSSPDLTSDVTSDQINPSTRESCLDRTFRKMTKDQIEVEERQFGFIFVSIIDRIAEGIPLTKALQSDQRQFDYARLLRWIHKDLKRKALYQEAQEIGSEMMAAEIVEIADGENNPLEDVQRSQLRINTRKFLLASWNRKRYGESKQIEMNQSISVTDALDRANNRVAQIVDATFEDIMDEGNLDGE